MDPCFLLKDELEYELACRGVVLKSTVPVLKKLLTELMSAEQAQGSAREQTAPLIKSVTYELEVCSAKISVLSNYISELSGKPDRTLFKRLVSRLYHVQNRLVLVKHDAEDDGIRKKALLEQCQVLLDRLEGQDDIVEDENLTVDDKEVLQNTLGELGNKIIQKLESGAGSSSQTVCNSRVSKEAELGDRENRSVSFATGQWGDDRGRSRLTRSSTFEEDVPRRKLVPVYQWGLKFAGGISTCVNAFLERVSELKEARNATDDDLYRYAIDFFEGDALIWYRANKEYASDWYELVILLKQAFQKPYYQEQLLAEIRARTQGHTESVLIYISVLQNMFNRLPNRITENEKIMIISKNLLPYYQQAICRDNFGSVPEMVNVLRIVERTKVNCDSFQQPTTNNNTLEPDLAYRLGSGTSTPRKGEVEAVAEVSALRGQEFAVRPNQPASQLLKRCWNCREVGHIFRDCSVPKQRLFCFKCGRFGLTSKECVCKGNDQGRNPKSAN
jgi:hypothetical protein